MNNKFRIVLVTLITFFTFIQATEFDPYQFKNRKLTAIKLSQPLNVDGILDDELYQTIPNSDYVQYVPENGSPATEKTEVWIGYDESAIYVGARMWDSEQDKIVSRIGRRDKNDNTDLFEVIFDSYRCDQ